MSADQLLIALMALFAVLGALDRIFGGRFGIGRFRFLRYRITVPGTARARILGLSVSVSI